MINFFSCKSGKKGGFSASGPPAGSPERFRRFSANLFLPQKRADSFRAAWPAGRPRIPYGGPFGIRGPAPAAMAPGKNFSRNEIPVHAALLPARGRGRRAAAAPGSGQNRPANLVRNMLLRQKRIKFRSFLP